MEGRENLFVGIFSDEQSVQFMHALECQADRVMEELDRVVKNNDQVESLSAPETYSNPEYVGRFRVGLQSIETWTPNIVNDQFAQIRRRCPMVIQLYKFMVITYLKNLYKHEPPKRINFQIPPLEPFVHTFFISLSHSNVLYNAQYFVIGVTDKALLMMNCIRDALYKTLTPYLQFSDPTPTQPYAPTPARPYPPTPAPSLPPTPAGIPTPATLPPTPAATPYPPKPRQSAFRQRVDEKRASQRQASQRQASHADTRSNISVDLSAPTVDPRSQPPKNKAGPAEEKRSHHSRPSRHSNHASHHDTRHSNHASHHDTRHSKRASHSHHEDADAPAHKKPDASPKHSRHSRQAPKLYDSEEEFSGDDTH